jgi:branched-chain amino acid transport system ATP-binding protein
MTLLEVRDVSKRFGGLLALQSIHCTIEQGQITGLIGPNGAGKTTLFNLIAGEFSPDRGSILLRGQPIHHLPSNAICKRGIARTFQMVRPFLNLTTWRNVVMAASFGQVPMPPRRQAEQSAWHWLEFIRSRPIACPWENANAWKLPAPWRRSRNSSCWTKPWRDSILPK